MALVGDNGAGKIDARQVRRRHPRRRQRPDPVRGPGGAHPRAEGRGPARDRGRLPGSRTLRQPRRRPEHVPRPRGQSRADPVGGADGAAHRRDAQVSGGHDHQVGPPDGGDALGRAAPVGRRRARGHVELEARHPRRADRGSRRRPDRAGARARAPSRQPGSRRDAHLPQPPRRLRDRRPDHRAPTRTERRRVRAARDDPAGGRRGDHRRACPRRSPGSRPLRGAGAGE